MIDSETWKIYSLVLLVWSNVLVDDEIMISSELRI